MARELQDVFKVLHDNAAPFMGVGSEVCAALVNDRRGLGIELKPSYYRQSVKNIKAVIEDGWGAKEPDMMFDEAAMETFE